MKDHKMRSIAAAIAGASMMFGAGTLILPPQATLRLPSHETSKTPRQKRKAKGRSFAITTLNAANRAVKSFRESEPHQIIVNRMTNWQRSQWARAGYPKTIASVDRYAAAKR